MGIGDELIVSGMARQAQEAGDPRKVRIEYEKGKRRWCELWDNNPRIARHEEEGDFQVLRPRDNYLRPYCAEKTPTKWAWKEYRPPVGEVYFHRWERNFGELNQGFVVLGPYLKPGASPNKSWDWGKWTELVRLFGLIGGIRMATVGPAGMRGLGVPHVTTTIREAAALIARARAVITQEGALHHIAAAVGTPAVVIYGGYISPRVTGYDGQVGLFVGDDLGCGMRVPCNHCAEAMESITPQRVIQAFFSLPPRADAPGQEKVAAAAGDRA